MTDTRETRPSSAGPLLAQAVGMLLAVGGVLWFAYLLAGVEGSVAALATLVGVILIVAGAATEHRGAGQ